MKLKDLFLEAFDDCGCSGQVLSQGMQYHLEKDRPLLENIYRPLSNSYFDLFREARDLYKKGALILTEEEESMLSSTDLGNFGHYNGIKVPLDYPMSHEQLYEAKSKSKGKKVELNKPKRGGSKKFYVFVRKPGGGIKKVSFGDTTGLKAKINDPKARKSFAARHKCAQAKDKTSAGYWSCRLPRYSSMLGLKSNFTGFW